MKNVHTTPTVLFAAALILAGCQSTPSSNSDVVQPAKPVEAKTEANPVLVAPAPQEATPLSKPPESMAMPEAKAETMTIAELQKRLTELGYKPGPADGVTGKRTTDALKQFQQANHLPATGNLDAETIRRLHSAKR